MKKRRKGEKEATQRMNENSKKRRKNEELKKGDMKKRESEIKGTGHIDKEAK